MHKISIKATDYIKHHHETLINICSNSPNKIYTTHSMQCSPIMAYNVFIKSWNNCTNKQTIPKSLKSMSFLYIFPIYHSLDEKILQ